MGKKQGGNNKSGLKHKENARYRDYKQNCKGKEEGATDTKINYKTRTEVYEALGNWGLILKQKPKIN